MKSSKQEIIINHDAKELYKIVLDIEKYPEFLPWCTSIEIISKSNNIIFANMIVSYKYFLSQTFTSQVFHDEDKLYINTNYIQGPLTDLKTEWIFWKLKKNKTKVIFNVKFKFQKFLHQKLAELLFNLIEKKMIESFKKRADKILN